MNILYNSEDSKVDTILAEIDHKRSILRGGIDAFTPRKPNKVREFAIKNIVTQDEAAEMVNGSYPLGPDASVDSRTKSIRFLMLSKDGNFYKLSQNHFNQHKVYNDNPKQGGFRRYYELLPDAIVDSDPFQRALTTFRDYFSLTPGTVVLSQIQTTLEEGLDGDVTGQGIHSDGADEAMILCLQRQNVSGAINELFYDLDGNLPYMGPTTLEEGSALLWSDNEVYHNVTAISPKSPKEGPAVRTVLVMHSDAEFLLNGTINKNNNFVLPSQHQ